MGVYIDACLIIVPNYIEVFKVYLDLKPASR